MLQQALHKIQHEIAAVNQGDITRMGNLVIDYIRQHPQHAVFIMADGKTIVGGFNVCWEEAKKRAARSNKSGQTSASLSEPEAVEIVLKYFGVPLPSAAPTTPAPVKVSVSLDDLL